MPDRDPEPGEILRGFADIKAEIRDLKKGFVTRAVYEAHREGDDFRTRQIELDVKEIKDAVAGIAEREDDRRNLRTQAYVGPIVSGVVVGITVAILLAVVGVGG